jgi:oxepin-CoA hydrolase/3-oxo-5,6-dehydrosuberyl-CoA semialdehyde dehydrogenase
MTTTATAPQATVDTVETVPSFIMDRWWTPDDGSAGSAVPVRDASTGEILAKVSTEGLDLGAVVEYGRTTGQAELGRLTFHQRALKLKELAQYLNTRREHFYTFSAQTGATKIDSMIDIDGGIGVLFTFGSKGRRELPNSQVVVEGPMEVLSKDGSFAGEHIYTRIPGVAVQINAFNFPVWGMLEKFAPAFLAGVPTIVKPATPTGYVAAAVVKAIVESNILPKGSLQLISGSVRGLLDVLDYRDLVAFTGSASTALSLKSHPNVVQGGVRFTSETDSLNAAILGPDAVEGTPEFDSFVKSVVTEMTAKAGQKCTAIRRAIVPRELVPAVSAAIGKRINERIVLGDPRAEGVTMGALASVEQLEDVRAAVQTMLDAGGELAYGTLDSPSVTSADGSTGVVDGGAFMAPVLLNLAGPRGGGGPFAGGVRSGVVGDRIQGHSRRRPPRRPRQRLPGRFGMHQRSRGCSRTSDWNRSPPRPHPDAQPRGCTFVNRPRLSCAALGPRWPGPRRWRRGAGRHPVRHAPHAAHRHPGLAQHAHRRHRHLASRELTATSRLKPKGRTRSGSR